MSTLAVAAQTIERTAGSPRSPTIKARYNRVNGGVSLKDRRKTISKYAPPEDNSSAITKMASNTGLEQKSPARREAELIAQMTQFTKVKIRDMPPSLKVWGRFGAKWVRNKYTLWHHNKWDLSPAVNVDDLSDWEQRFAEMHVASNYHKREMLKTQHVVKDAIDEFWLLLHKTEDNNLPKEEYVALQLAIYKQLIAWSPEAEQDAIAVAEADWEVDTLGRPYLPFVTFFNSMFDLADNWTETTVEDEYSDFLLSLRRSITSDNRCIEFKRRQLEIDNRNAQRAYALQLHQTRQKKGRIEAAPAHPQIEGGTKTPGGADELGRKNRLTALGHHATCPCHGCKNPHSIVHIDDYPDMTVEEEEAEEEENNAPSNVHPLLALSGDVGQPGGIIKSKPRSLKSLLAARRLKEEEFLLCHQVFKLREVLALRFIELDPCATGHVEAHLFLQVILFSMHLVGPIPQSILVMLDVWRKFHDVGNGKVSYKDFMYKFDTLVNLDDFLWTGITFSFREPLDYHHWCRCPACSTHRENIKYMANDKIDLHGTDTVNTKYILQKINLKNRTNDRIRKGLISPTFNAMMTLDMRRLPLHKPGFRDCDCARCVGSREMERLTGTYTSTAVEEGIFPITDMAGNPKSRDAQSLRARVQPHWFSSLSTDTAARKSMELGTREAMSLKKFLSIDSVAQLMDMFEEHAHSNRTEDMRQKLTQPLFLSVMADRVMLSLSLLHTSQKWREHALQSIRQMFFAESNNLITILDSMYPGGDGRASRHDLLQACLRVDMPVSVGVIDEIFACMKLTEEDRIDYREFLDRLKVSMTSGFYGTMTRDMRFLLGPLLEAMYINREKLTKEFRAVDIKRDGYLVQRQVMDVCIRYFKLDKDKDHHLLVVLERWISYEADELTRVFYTQFLDQLRVVDVIGEINT